MFFSLKNFAFFFITFAFAGVWKIKIGLFFVVVVWLARGWSTRTENSLSNEFRFQSFRAFSLTCFLFAYYDHGKSVWTTWNSLSTLIHKSNAKSYASKIFIHSLLLFLQSFSAFAFKQLSWWMTLLNFCIDTHFRFGGMVVMMMMMIEMLLRALLFINEYCFRHSFEKGIRRRRRKKSVDVA